MAPTSLRGLSEPGCAAERTSDGPLAGRDIAQSEIGQPVALIERGFAAYHQLAPEGEFRVGGTAV